MYETMKLALAKKYENHETNTHSEKRGNMDIQSFGHVYAKGRTGVRKHGVG